MPLIYVIPQEGKTVPDPAQARTPGRHLPLEGRLVEHSDYWQRRVRDGDVVIGMSPDPQATE